MRRRGAIRRRLPTRFVVMLVAVPALVSVFTAASSATSAAPAAATTAAASTSTGGSPPLAAMGVLAARNYGTGPMADVLYWADQKKACGLARDQLAAMIMVPTFTETGAGTQYTPSPMTLSRYDNQAGLYAFKDVNTAYRKAFFHPGIGMWQFDSAGFWNLTAGTAINTYTAAQTAATLMAQRWCQNPTRAYAWAPWYYCGTTAICENVYNEIYDGTALVNVALDVTVMSLGGMQARSCDIYAVGTLPCYYVNPANAQGLASWAAPGFGPSPITAPFYVFESGGREFRYWLSVDTGYPITVIASKPVTADARTSLTWASRDDLCDLTTLRGACNHGPFGRLDSTAGGPGSVLATGWAIDPDVTAPINVHVYVDGQYRAASVANLNRTDLGAAFPAFGPAHGFSVTVPNVTPGSHTLCSYGINVGAGGNTLIGCQSVVVPTGAPWGSLDQVTAGASQIFARGWALDPDTGGSIAVHVYVDGVGYPTVADQTRNDIATAFPLFGAAHGFSTTVGALGPGNHSVCAYGINVGAGGNALLGCQSVNMPSGDPFGAFDIATPGFGIVAVSGWAIDPDVTTPIGVHVYIDGVKRGEGTAWEGRADVGAAFPIFGTPHGYAVTATPVTGGAHTVCVYAINAGPGVNSLIACRDVLSSGDPSGALDEAIATPGQVTVRGWAIDPDTTGAVTIHAYVDGQRLGIANANLQRGDIGVAYPGYGALHGYLFNFGPVGAGAHNVCTYVINTGPGGNRLLGCTTVTSSGDPFGNLESATQSGSTISVKGWGIDPDTTGADTVHIYVDGVGQAVLTAAVTRPDVGATYPGYGNQHGYLGTISGVAAGSHTVCGYAINVAGPGTNAGLGCLAT